MNGVETRSTRVSVCHETKATSANRADQDARTARLYTIHFHQIA